MSDVDGLIKFVLEREEIRMRRAEGKPAPWTNDPILQEYRFCNVQREYDRVSIWVRDQWRNPNINDPDLWFAMVVARFINWPDTLAELGYPALWDPMMFLNVMAERKAKKLKCYTGAYMVRADREHADKAAYQEAVVFTPMWNARDRLRPKEGDTLNSYHMLLGQFHGLGSFMAAQIVADLKYAPPLRTASDWETFAASGPGSRRGLNRVAGRKPDAPYTEEEWRADLGRLREQVIGPLKEVWGDMIHNQDLQNCLCEFDKYERVRLGEGKPRARFVSHAP